MNKWLGVNDRCLKYLSPVSPDVKNKPHLNYISPVMNLIYLIMSGEYLYDIPFYAYLDSLSCKEILKP